MPRFNGGTPRTSDDGVRVLIEPAWSAGTRTFHDYEGDASGVEAACESDHTGGSTIVKPSDKGEACPDCFPNGLPTPEDN